MQQRSPSRLWPLWQRSRRCSNAIGSEKVSGSVGQRGSSVWRVARYRELEAGKQWPDYATWDRMCKLHGWPQTFVAVL